jgi:hypothetical protein
MGELKKPSAIEPAASSFVLVCMIVLMATDGKKTSDIEEIFWSLTLLAFAACTIWIWIRYVRQYVNFAIEQKLRQNNKESKD